MRFKLLLVVLVVSMLGLGACASQPPSAPQWVYEKEAVQVHIKADAKLNFDQGVPHTLLLCLYQLKDPNAFNQLSEDIDGIYKLLECGLFDPAVATAKRLIVHPNEDLTVNLDRAEGAKYVGAVAGYYQLDKDRMTRLYDIPVVIEKKGFVKKAQSAKPAVLTIDLVLGPTQIVK